jgi:hypothetical protein
MGGVELYDRTSGELLDDWAEATSYGNCGQCPYDGIETESPFCIGGRCCGEKTITLSPGIYRFQADASVMQDAGDNCAPYYSSAYVWINAYEEPEPITITCESMGGIELVSETVRMDSLDKWRGYITDTGWSRLFAAITLQRDGGGYAIGAVNEAYRSLILNSDNPEPQLFAVPEATTGGVDGPQADIEVTAQSDDIDLLSVCVLPAQDNDYCPNGVEALQPAERPLDLDPLNGHWVGTAEITATHIVIKYTMGRGDSPGVWSSPEWTDGIDRSRVTQQLCVNSICHLLQTDIYGQEIITYTLPDDGVIAHPFSGFEDPYIELEVDNREDAVRMYSICVMDANDVYSNPVTVTPEECHLLNPEFSETIGYPNWQPSEIVYPAGAVERDSGGTGSVFLRWGYGIGQPPQQEKANTWDLEIRARQAGGDQLMYFGSSRATQFRGGAQWFTATMAPDYDIYRETVYLKPDDEVEVFGVDIQVDYVCLRTPSELISDPGVCDPPVFDPPTLAFNSVQNVLEFIWALLWEVGELLWQGMIWMICEIQKLLAKGINPIYDAIRELVIEWPVFPDPGSGLVSYAEWLAEAAYVILDWIGINAEIISGWVPRTGAMILEWLVRLLTEILYWFFDQMGWGTGILDDTGLILDDLLLFLDAIIEEANFEFGQLLALLRDAGNILLLPVQGFRRALAGSNQADIGLGSTGYAGYIWQGMEYMNARIQNTPLPALNVLALGVITLGLVQWTLKKYLSVLSS